MIELGYMAKRITARPAWLDNAAVSSVYSVANCISPDFCDYVSFWNHNGFCFFNTPAGIGTTARESGADLTDLALLYYRAYPQQFDPKKGGWIDFHADPRIGTSVLPPPRKTLLGFDVVSYSQGYSHECSPVSCNNIAACIHVNEYCLIDSLDDAIHHLENGEFQNSEPGPYRVIAVNLVSVPFDEQ